MGEKLKEDQVRHKGDEEEEERRWRGWRLSGFDVRLQQRGVRETPQPEKWSDNSCWKPLILKYDSLKCFWLHRCHFAKTCDFSQSSDVTLVWRWRWSRTGAQKGLQKKTKKKQVNPQVVCAAVGAWSRYFTSKTLDWWTVHSTQHVTCEQDCAAFKSQRVFVSGTYMGGLLVFLHCSEGMDRQNRWLDVSLFIEVREICKITLRECMRRKSPTYNKWLNKLIFLGWFMIKYNSSQLRDCPCIFTHAN